MTYTAAQTLVTYEDGAYVKYYSGDTITTFTPADYIIRSGAVTVS